MGINGIGRLDLDETRFVPVVSPVPLKSPLLDHDEHTELIHAGLQQAIQLGKVEIPIFEHVERIVEGVFSLARYQTPFKAQNDRGTCWAFAGAAALEAAYRRNYHIEIDLSEEYIFHIGKPSH